MKLSIIIPVYNEEQTIGEILKRVKNVTLPLQKEIIIVNDSSSDKTERILESMKKRMQGIRVFHHIKNQGKGAAIRTGLKASSGDYVVIQDADLEYNPKDLVRLVAPITSGKTSVVYGTRLKRLPNLQREERTPRFVIHYFGNRFLSLVTSLLYGQWITDMETCYKIFPGEFARKITLNGNGFDFEPEITAKLMKAGYRITEVPIAANPRGYEEGKKLQTVPEGIRAIWTLVKYRVGN